MSAKTPMNDFAVFILTHGRADRVFTHNTLRKQGYDGKIYIVVDDTDSQIPDYKERYGDSVVVFPKKDAIEMTDAGDNQNKHAAVVYARNYAFEVAKQVGVTYFLVLDDDYTDFRFAFDHEMQYITKQGRIKNLNETFRYCLDFFIASGATSLAMAQGGDFIGGEGSKVATCYLRNELSRKAMNSFFCSVNRPFKFVGRINEDVNTYVEMGLRGHLFITLAPLRIQQKPTQSNAGGLTDIYLDLGTYVKSFYSVMYAPSCVTVGEMGVFDRRLHHKIKWKNAVPMVIDECHKKKV
jgi:hypothetical protein